MSAVTTLASKGLFFLKGTKDKTQIFTSHFAHLDFGVKASSVLSLTAGQFSSNLMKLTGTTAVGPGSLPGHPLLPLPYIMGREAHSLIMHLF